MLDALNDKSEESLLWHPDTQATLTDEEGWLPLIECLLVYYRRKMVVVCLRRHEWGNF